MICYLDIFGNGVAVIVHSLNRYPCIIRTILPAAEDPADRVSRLCAYIADQNILYVIGSQNDQFSREKITVGTYRICKLMEIDEAVIFVDRGHIDMCAVVSRIHIRGLRICLAIGRPGHGKGSVTVICDGDRSFKRKMLRGICPSESIGISALRSDINHIPAIEELACLVRRIGDHLERLPILNDLRGLHLVCRIGEFKRSYCIVILSAHFTFLSGSIRYRSKVMDRKARGDDFSALVVNDGIYREAFCCKFNNCRITLIGSRGIFQYFCISVTRFGWEVDDLEVF